MMRARAAGEQLDVSTNKGQWRTVYGMEYGAQADRHEQDPPHHQPARRVCFGITASRAGTPNQIE
jgi:hypothetical protein